MIIRTVLIASSLLFADSVFASVSGDAVNGKKVFESKTGSNGQPVAPCTSCHGVAATGVTPDGKPMPNENPIIAGQYSDYLSKALHDYKNKKRAAIGMQGNAGRLSDKEIADVSVYLGSLKSNITDLSKHEE